MDNKTTDHGFADAGGVFTPQRSKAPDAKEAALRLLRTAAPRARDLAETSADSRAKIQAKIQDKVGTKGRARQSYDIHAQSADVRLIDQFGIENCQKYSVLPVAKIGAITSIAVPSDRSFQTCAKALSDCFGPVLPLYASKENIETALCRVRAKQMVSLAENKTELTQSCRHLSAEQMKIFCLAIVLLTTCAMVIAPALTFPAMVWISVALLICFSALKLAALMTSFRETARDKTPVATLYPPTVSILVPLYKETDIASDLIRRLKRLNYPTQTLDICLVVEQSDVTTQATLAQTQLPAWMRCISVPKGSIKTKPRAMNYALGFCRGTIIGIYDAEDSPDPDQINTVVQRFANAPPNVACLQGILDFYNSKSNWMARCFTIEYAMWFRTILPAFARMGLVVPLGGTTLFFRRDILEKLGGWDAHNVTEDADLGVRIARAGYRTELINTTTYEEANCAAWPWVKQRSRWLKGYAMTYVVHMRDPLKLLQDLGWKRFVGFQLLFGGTILQFLLAPLLWSFWALMVLGLHPMDHIFSQATLLSLFLLFMAAELINVAIAVRATRADHHKGLWPWALTLSLYFPLATAAVIKAIYEMTTRPFFWDKTAHGKSPVTATD